MCTIIIPSGTTSALRLMNGLKRKEWWSDCVYISGFVFSVDSVHYYPHILLDTHFIHICLILCLRGHRLRWHPTLTLRWSLVLTDLVSIRDLEQYLTYLPTVEVPNLPYLRDMAEHFNEPHIGAP